MEFRINFSKQSVRWIWISACLIALLSLVMWMGEVNAQNQQSSQSSQSVRVPDDVSITGPLTANFNETLEYTIAYNGVPGTGGVKYTPPANFTVTSTSPTNSGTEDSTLVWSQQTLGGSDGNITINGIYETEPCADTTHSAIVYDTHSEGSPTISSTSFTTMLVCKRFLPLMAK